MPKLLWNRGDFQWRAFDEWQLSNGFLDKSDWAVFPTLQIEMQKKFENFSISKAILVIC